MLLHLSESTEEVHAQAACTHGGDDVYATDIFYAVVHDPLQLRNASRTYLTHMGHLLHRRLKDSVPYSLGHHEAE